MSELKSESEYIQHLVLSGGGPSGIAGYGTINSLLDSKKLNINEIKTIHASSVGSLISLFICFQKLGIDIDSIHNYIINRPFHETFKININHIVNIYHKKGIYDETVSLIFFKPFFELLEMSTTTTLLELYELTKIELYIYVFNVNKFVLEQLSYKNHPNLPIIYAIYMSSSIPIIFTPYNYINQYYIDGSFLCNYPIKQCIENSEKDEKILGIYYDYGLTDKYIHCNTDSNILEFIGVLCYNFISYINHLLYPTFPLPNNILEIPIKLDKMSFSKIKNILFHEEDRLLLYETGYNQGFDFCRN